MNDIIILNVEKYRENKDTRSKQFAFSIQLRKKRKLYCFLIKALSKIQLIKISIPILFSQFNCSDYSTANHMFRLRNIKFSRVAGKILK